jgi:hypothetical protein
MPLQMNPAEFVLELLNVDFATHQDTARERLQQMQNGWQTSTQANSVSTEIASVNHNMREDVLGNGKQSQANFSVVVLALLHRSFIKSYRDIVVYGVRIAMYTGTAFRIHLSLPLYDPCHLIPLLTIIQVWQSLWAPCGYDLDRIKPISSHSSMRFSSAPPS